MHLTTPLLLSLNLLTLTTHTSALHAKLSLDYSCPGEGCFTTLNLKDYSTGSTYTCGAVNPSFCTYEGRCPVGCQETSPGGYNFNAQFWQTSDGCRNMDFQGALSAGHEYCCGSNPCNFNG